MESQTRVRGTYLSLTSLKYMCLLLLFYIGEGSRKHMHIISCFPFMSSQVQTCFIADSWKNGIFDIFMTFESITHNVKMPSQARKLYTQKPLLVFGKCISNCIPCILTFPRLILRKMHKRTHVCIWRMHLNVSHTS